MKKPWILIACLISMTAATAQVPDDRTPEAFRRGHSKHGDAFDVGPRERPWAMEGIGSTHFPITTSIPEVQKWFDQGNTLLHSFWYHEAERAFRWCLKLEPENAMAYWGLVRTARDGGDREKRDEAFMKEAVKRKHKVSARERAYIEAYEILYEPDLGAPEGGKSRRDRFREALEKLVLEYPDDLEAKANYAHQILYLSSRIGTDLLLKDVLAKAPDHPGAHHYRIHNWDGPDGDQALDSARRYGEIAPRIGHALHMPGHTFSGVGMWHEAAIAMDAATRAEQAYMRERMVFPFNTWNYAHNRNYLSYLQEQLGMAEAALAGARQVLSAPLDPKYNDPDKFGPYYSGLLALIRGLVKFERWQEILDPRTFDWRDTTRDKMFKAYCETMAHLGLGAVDRAIESLARHAALKPQIEKGENKWLEERFTIQSLELRGLLAAKKGEMLSAIDLLSEAAEKELKMREQNDDPPIYPNVIYTTLGRVYLENASAALAAQAFEKTLEVSRNDGFALAGLAEAHAALGDRQKASQAYGRLLHVWSDADPGNKWLERARKLGLEAQPKDVSPGPQRSYRATTLEKFGPNRWEPYAAPSLDAVDSMGQRVGLEDFRGKNLLLVFYIGGQCAPCVGQLDGIKEKYKDFKRAETEVVAVSSDSPETNRETAQNFFRFASYRTRTSRTRGGSSPTTTSRRWSFTPRSSSTPRAGCIGRGRAATRSPTSISF